MANIFKKLFKKKKKAEYTFTTLDEDDFCCICPNKDWCEGYKDDSEDYIKAQGYKLIEEVKNDRT